MQLKNQMSKRLISTLLASALFMLSITAFPAKAYAAGWLNYSQDISLGNTVTGTMKQGDYYGPLENAGSSYYWHTYKFSMPQSGFLNIYFESAERKYNNINRNGFAIFSDANPDELLWRSNQTENKITLSYSAARAIYYGSAQITLDKGNYYFAVRTSSTFNILYYLTLSYKEPTINVTSISLNPFKITLGTGTQQTITATVLPNNATDKTITWQSANPSIATVEQGVVTGVSAGTTTITASSLDGEITASCIVTVTCPHDYQTSFAQASQTDNGYFTERCKKCGNIRQNRIIYAIDNTILSRKSVTYNGKVHMPSVIVQDSQGKYLTYNTDYTLSFTGDMRNVGKHSVHIKFKDNYKGSATRTFTILPKSTTITKLKPKKKGFSVNWKKQSTQTTGYELAYSTSSSFSKSKTNIVTLGRNKNKKTIAKLRKNKRYYVRIRTYKNITANGQTAKLCSKWSKAKMIVTRR